MKKDALLEILSDWNFWAKEIDSGINSTYALSAIFTCLFLAIFVRSFQVYPIWVMVSISLGLSLSWFQTIIGLNRIDKDSALSLSDLSLKK